MIAAGENAAARALAWAVRDEGPLQLPAGPVLFLGAQAEPALFARPGIDWQCEQSMRPLAQALEDLGIASRARIDADGFGMSLVLPARQRDEARAQLARAVAATAPGGTVLAAAGNQAGGRGLADDLAALAGGAATDAKFKCRLAWARIDPTRTNADLLADWLALDAPRWLELDGRSVCTRPGLFAWDRVDAASRLLAAQLPDSLAGRAADLGAGWGYLAMQLLQRCPGINHVDLYEANARALEPARQNLERLIGPGDRRSFALHWHDVSRGLPEKYDVIISNPPFHLGRADLPQLGQAFLRTAADALVADGQAWIVANRHLPYEALLAERFNRVDTISQREGFKLIRAAGPKR